MVQFPDDAQPIQCQPGSQMLDDVCFGGDEVDQAARADDVHVLAEFGPEAGDHAFDQADVTEHQA